MNRAHNKYMKYEIKCSKVRTVIHNVYIGQMATHVLVLGLSLAQL